MGVVTYFFFFSFLFTCVGTCVGTLYCYVRTKVVNLLAGFVIEETKEPRILKIQSPDDHLRFAAGDARRVAPRVLSFLAVLGVVD